MMTSVSAHSIRLCLSRRVRCSSGAERGLALQVRDRSARRPAGGSSIAEGNGLSGWVARHRRPLVNGLPAVEFNGAGLLTANIQLQSALICPLMVGDRDWSIAVYHHAPECIGRPPSRARSGGSPGRGGSAQRAAVRALPGTGVQGRADRVGEPAGHCSFRSRENCRVPAGRRRRSRSFCWISTTSRSSTMSTGTLPAIARCRKLRNTAADDAAVRHCVSTEATNSWSCSRRVDPPKPKSSAAVCRKLSRRFHCTLTMAVKSRCRSAPAPRSFRKDGETYERLLARADRRMYRNKAESKTTLSMQVGTRGQAEVARAHLSLTQ